jgi:hypothetical protein
MGDDVDGYATLRSTERAVVILDHASNESADDFDIASTSARVLVCAREPTDWRSVGSRATLASVH